MIDCKFCQQEFHQTRSNQIYCKKKCRNAFNNQAYVNRTARYKKMADGVRKSDNILYQLHKLDKVVYLDRSDFRKQGIYITKARKLIYSKDSILEKIIFLDFQLVHVKDNIYKIEKNEPATHP
jgi:hypothetical protein